MKTAICELGLDKALGPDGLNLECIKFLWNDIKEILLENYRHFADTGLLPKGFNSSFVTLVLKVSLLSKVTDFRPISLINTTSKIFIKILANRMGVFMDRLVDELSLLQMKFVIQF